MIFIIPCLYRLYKVCWLGASRQGWWKWGLLVHPFRFGEHIQWPMAMFCFICQRACNLSVCFLKTWTLLLNSQPYGPNFLAEVYTGYFTVRPVKWRMWPWKTVTWEPTGLHPKHKYRRVWTGTYWQLLLAHIWVHTLTAETPQTKGKSRILSFTFISPKFSAVKESERPGELVFPPVSLGGFHLHGDAM